jgi:hypothetical protein
LKGVKGETNRQDDIHCLKGIVPSNQLGNGIGIVDEEIVVLENKQHHASGDDAEDEPGFFRPSFGSRYFDSCEIVNQNGDEKYEDILRDEKHVEYAAADKQKPCFSSLTIFENRPIKTKYNS